MKRSRYRLDARYLAVEKKKAALGEDYLTDTFRERCEAEWARRHEEAQMHARRINGIQSLGASGNIGEAVSASTTTARKLWDRLATPAEPLFTEAGGSPLAATARLCASLVGSSPSRHPLHRSLSPAHDDRGERVTSGSHSPTLVTSPSARSLASSISASASPRPSDWVARSGVTGTTPRAARNFGHSIVARRYGSMPVDESVLDGAATASVHSTSRPQGTAPAVTAARSGAGSNAGSLLRTPSKPQLSHGLSRVQQLLHDEDEDDNDNGAESRAKLVAEALAASGLAPAPSAALSPVLTPSPEPPRALPSPEDIDPADFVPLGPDQLREGERMQAALIQQLVAETARLGGNTKHRLFGR